MWSDVPVRSFWSCKTKDWAGTVAKNCEYCKNYPPKPENNCTTGKFRNFYPISKKNLPELESGWPSYGLTKLDCQTENESGECLHQQNTVLNLTSKRPSILMQWKRWRQHKFRRIWRQHDVMMTSACTACWRVKKWTRFHGWRGSTGLLTVSPWLHVYCLCVGWLGSTCLRITAQRRRFPKGGRRVLEIAFRLY